MKYLLLAIILLSTVFGSNHQLKAEVNVQKAKDYYRKGYDAYNKRDYKTAINFFQKATEYDPKDAITYNCIGTTYYRLEDYYNGIKFCQKAISVNPLYAEAYYNVGYGYHLKENYDMALDYYQKAVEINPNNVEAKDALESIKEYNQTKKQQQYVDLGIQSCQKRDYNAAIKYHQQAIDLDPNYADAYSRIGEAYTCKEEYDNAIKYYKKALKLNPNHADAYYLGLSYDAKADFTNSLKYYKKALVYNPDYDPAIYKIGLIYYNRGNYDLAIKKINEAIRLDTKAFKPRPYTAWLYNSLGLAYSKKGNQVAAIQNYQKALKIEPGFEQAQINLEQARNQTAKTEPSVSQNNVTPEPLFTPHQTLNKLRDRMYCVGETGAQIDRFIAEEQDAVLQIRNFINNGGDKNSLIEKNSKNGQTPLIAAAFMGYSEIVSELLNYQNVKDSINNVDNKGMSAWIYSNFALRQSMWSANPNIFNNPFSFVPLYVTQPYYTEQNENPYIKTRKLLESAEAKTDMKQAKELWLSFFKLQNESTKKRVEDTDDLLEATIIDGAEKLQEYLEKQKKK